MKSIAEQVQEVIIAEEVKKLEDRNYQEFLLILEQLEQLNLIKKPEYTFPLVDTIGRTYFPSINKHLNY